MPRSIAPHREYYGTLIWYAPRPGHLSWTAGRFAADTLAGIKRLIREDQGQ